MKVILFGDTYPPPQKNQDGKQNNRTIFVVSLFNVFGVMFCSFFLLLLVPVPSLHAYFKFIYLIHNNSLAFCGGHLLVIYLFCLRLCRVLLFRTKDYEKMSTNFERQTYSQGG